MDCRCRHANSSASGDSFSKCHSISLSSSQPFGDSGDVWKPASPVAFCHENRKILLFLRRGATIIVANRSFPFSVLDAAQRHPITFIYGSAVPLSLVSPAIGVAMAGLVALIWMLPWGPLDRLFLGRDQ